jgi:hypothetical protein
MSATMIVRGFPAGAQWSGESYVSHVTRDGDSVDMSELSFGTVDEDGRIQLGVADGAHASHLVAFRVTTDELSCYGKVRGWI